MTSKIWVTAVLLALLSGCSDSSNENPPAPDGVAP